MNEGIECFYFRHKYKLHYKQCGNIIKAFNNDFLCPWAACLSYGKFKIIRIVDYKKPL